MIISSKIFEIIARHKGSHLYVFYGDDEGISYHDGILIALSEDMLQLKAINSFDKYNIPLNDDSVRILHIYNNNGIDLLKAKETPSLAKKLRVPEIKKLIIKIIKPYINKELYFIFRQSTGVTLSKGKFVDMGMAGFVIKVAPFYNNQITLRYENVLHIYNEEENDLIG